ncbi:MAG: energy transducer TonB [Thermoanaerobaculia bacterium]
MTRTVLNLFIYALVAISLYARCSSQQVSPASTGEYVTTTLGPTLRIAGPQFAPKVITRTAPVYPAAAREQGTSGLVKLEALIDVNGNVVDAKVLEGLPYGLSEAAVAAVKQWTFAPTIDNGHAVPVLFELHINFNVH